LNRRGTRRGHAGGVLTGERSMAGDSFFDAAAAAWKVLGKDAKIPIQIGKILDEAGSNSGNAMSDFMGAANALSSSMGRLDTQFGQLDDLVTRYIKYFEKYDFELDSKNKDEAKKIAAGRKIILDYLNAIDKRNSNDKKSLANLAKQVVSLTSFKPSK
jgi:hypothetical protein